MNAIILESLDSFLTVLLSSSFGTIIDAYNVLYDLSLLATYFGNQYYPLPWIDRTRFTVCSIVEILLLLLNPLLFFAFFSTPRTARCTLPCRKLCVVKR